MQLQRFNIYNTDASLMVKQMSVAYMLFIKDERGLSNKACYDREHLLKETTMMLH